MVTKRYITLFLNLLKSYSSKKSYGNKTVLEAIKNITKSYSSKKSYGNKTVEPSSI